MKTELLIQMDGVRGVQENEQVRAARTYGSHLYCLNCLPELAPICCDVIALTLQAITVL